MAHEAAAVAQAITEKMAADATLVATIAVTKHFAESAPQDAALPFIVFRQRSAGEDSQVINPKRVMTSPLIDIGPWVEADPYSSAARTAANRIDAIFGTLSHYSVTLDSMTFEVSSRREGGAWIREEIDLKAGGKKFYWIGGSYRFSISQA